MKAIVKTRKEPGIELLEVDVPKVGDADMLVKVAAGGLCGSDVHYYQWLPGSEIVHVPVILGHEFAGEVAQVGSDYIDLGQHGKLRVREIIHIVLVQFQTFGLIARFLETPGHQINPNRQCLLLGKPAEDSFRGRSGIGEIPVVQMKADYLHLGPHGVLVAGEIIHIVLV